MDKTQLWMNKAKVSVPERAGNVVLMSEKYINNFNKWTLHQHSDKTLKIKIP